MYNICRSADGACYSFFIVSPLLPGWSPESAGQLSLFIHVPLQSKSFSKWNGQNPIPNVALSKSEWPPGWTVFKCPSHSGIMKKLLISTQRLCMNNQRHDPMGQYVRINCGG